MLHNNRFQLSTMNLNSTYGTKALFISAISIAIELFLVLKSAIAMRQRFGFIGQMGLFISVMLSRCYTIYQQFIIRSLRAKDRCTSSLYILSKDVIFVVSCRPILYEQCGYVSRPTINTNSRPTYSKSCYQSRTPTAMRQFYDLGLFVKRIIFNLRATKGVVPTP